MAHIGALPKFALAALIAANGMAFALAVPADAAVVYCKTVGVPKGCVVRPVHPVVYCKTIGVPKGCIVRHY